MNKYQYKYHHTKTHFVDITYSQHVITCVLRAINNINISALKWSERNWHSHFITFSLLRSYLKNVWKILDYLCLNSVMNFPNLFFFSTEIPPGGTKGSYVFTVPSGKYSIFTALLICSSFGIFAPSFMIVPKLLTSYWCFSTTMKGSVFRARF